VDDAEREGLKEKAGDARRVHRRRQERAGEAEVRDGEIQDRERPRRQAVDPGQALRPGLDPGRLGVHHAAGS
jgi:hypothetical protein